MKLLLDQNLSRKLIKEVEGVYPGSCHITSALSETAEDSEIWDYARENGFTIVTKDDDFEQRSILLGHPRLSGSGSEIVKPLTLSSC